MTVFRLRGYIVDTQLIQENINPFKQKIMKIKTTFALLSYATVILGSIIIGACSGDDDYDIYAGKELKTRAGGMMPSNGEGTSNPRDDPEGYANDIDNCGGVVLAQLHRGTNTDGCNTDTKAYYHIKEIAGGSCRNMTPEKILQVAQRIDGLNFSSYYSTDLNYDSAYHYINQLNSVYDKIIIIRVAEPSSEHSGNHAFIGKELINTSKNHAQPSWKIVVYKKDGSLTNYSIDIIKYIIY